MANRYHELPVERRATTFKNYNRGKLGLETEFRDRRIRIPPTQMIATNRNLENTLEWVLKDAEIPIEEFMKEGVLRVFTARQFIVRGAAKKEVVELVRGTRLVDEEEAQGEDRVSDLARGIGRWMMANIDAEGALPYLYWPSAGKLTNADNAIRRFLATMALSRLAEVQSCAEMREAAVRNLRSNLRRYFRKIGDGKGAIVEPMGAKLGAAALGGLAILESPTPEAFAEELTLLARGIHSLRDRENGFRTFHFPSQRDGENWNFYSGEALLFWAEARKRGLPWAPGDGECTEVFEACRRRHREMRNPAFIPWHTQACAGLFELTGVEEYRRFVFEMNDWLLAMQQWDEVEPEFRGRFCDARNPEYGPPHASSTGVYLEGLVDAAAMAEAYGRTGRAEVYRTAIARGVRSLRQLQFQDEYDMFYIVKRNKVRGALRTEIYDNAVRVDCAAHALLAATKILKAR